MKLAGIILILLGIIALVYQGFSYNQTKKDAQIGSLVIQHDETRHVWVPPVVGAACIVAGAAALFMGARKT